MKTVPYINKATTAGTQYRKTRKQDTDWILSQCKTIVDCSPYDDRLTAPNPRMNRQSTGKRNSVATICQGVIDNFNTGQYDLSDKQMPSLEEAFRVGEEVIENIESVIFEEVTSLPKINPVAAPSSNAVESVFEDLFEITITVRGKK